MLDGLLCMARDGLYCQGRVSIGIDASKIGGPKSGFSQKDVMMVLSEGYRRVGCLLAKPTVA